MKLRYYATVATMAAHSERSDLRAKALGQLVAAMGERTSCVQFATFIHDGATIMHVDGVAARLLGARIVGCPVLSLMGEERRAEGQTRLERLRRGETNPPWSGTIHGLAGPLLVRATVHPMTYNAAPAYLVEFIGLTTPTLD